MGEGPLDGGAPPRQQGGGRQQAARPAARNAAPAQAEALVRANFRHEEAFMERRA